MEIIKIIIYCVIFTYAVIACKCITDSKSNNNNNDKHKTT